MNREQMKALNRVLEHFAGDDLKHYREAGRPAGHIAEDLMVLDQYRGERSLEEAFMDDESKARVTRDDEMPEWMPTVEELVAGSTRAERYVGAARDAQSHAGGIPTEQRIIWELLSLAHLPPAIDLFVRNAVEQELPVELRAPVIAVLEAAKRERLDDEIPF